jgi:hypothetical protein
MKDLNSKTVLVQSEDNDRIKVMIDDMEEQNERLEIGRCDTETTDIDEDVEIIDGAKLAENIEFLEDEDDIIQQQDVEAEQQFEGDPMNPVKEVKWILKTEGQKNHSE